MLPIYSKNLVTGLEVYVWETLFLKYSNIFVVTHLVF